MILSGVFGVIAGLLGFFPLLLVRYHVKRGHPLVRKNPVMWGLLCIGFSFLLFIVLIFIAWLILPDDRGMFLAFSIVLVATFFVATTGYMVVGMPRK